MLWRVEAGFQRGETCFRKKHPNESHPEGIGPEIGNARMER